MVKRERILVIDDDEEIRRTLSKILGNEGYDVETASSGEQAIRMSKDQAFNLALIDIQLPDMHGTWLLDKLKKTEPEMIKIILTGHPSMKNAVEAVNRGAHGYIVKPFNVKELLEKIEEHLERQRERCEYGEQKITEFIETRVKQIETERRQYSSGSVSY